MVTIKDVAKLAGVSTSTVSRALSCKIPVDKETKLRVMRAVQELNYQPNTLAKGLKEGKTNTIGLIIPNIRNPIFPSIVRGVEDVARKSGYTVILCNTDEDLTVEKDYVDKLRTRWVDGLIFATAGQDIKHILTLCDEGFPVVLLVRHIDERVNAVIIDNLKAAFDAVMHLINTGHKKIAIMNGNLRLPLYLERFEGYKKALEVANIRFEDELVIDEIPGKENGYYSVYDMLKKNILPDAIFATSDLKALGALRAVKDMGLKVPEDLSVVGFENLEISNFLDPPLTTVSQPWYEMGSRATSRLIDLINKECLHKPEIEIMDAKLIVRKSTLDRE